MKKRIGTFVAVLAILTGTMYVGVALAANPSADLDQCANDPSPSPNTNGCATTSTSWVNGNLGQSKSVYVEGDSIPYRIRFSNLSTNPAVVHHVVIEWDTTKGGKHALDYLTTWNASVADANPCLGINAAFCGGTLASASTLTIPKDPQVDPGVPSGSGANGGQPAGQFAMWGGSLGSYTTSDTFQSSGYIYSDGTGFAGDKTARIELNFIATQPNPVLAWGGHIATRQAWGQTNSAVSIPGSPYHTRLISLDGSGGNQDRSLAAAAVIFPGSITIIKDAVPDDAQNFAFSSTGGLTPSSFTLDDDGDSTLSNTQIYGNIQTFGTYTVTETQVTNWTLSFQSPACTVASPNGGSQSASLATSTVTINLNEGEDVTCTFVNTHTFNSPDISTQVKTTGTDGAIGGGDDSDVANGGHVGIGTEVYDTSSLANATTGAGGTVTYYVEKGDAACTLDGATSLGEKSVTNHVPAASNEYTLATAGTYYFWAVYSGDANNNGDTSGCDTELVVVDKNSTTTSTQVKETVGDGDVADDGHIDIGESIYDTATVASGSNAGGTVSYYYQLQTAEDATPNCTSGTLISTETVTNGVGAASDGISFSDAGTYELWAVYSGDDNNIGSTSTCGTETVVVDKNDTTTTTQVKKSADDSDLADGGHIAIGESIYDTADVADETADAGGTVSFYYRLQTADDTTPNCTSGTLISTESLGDPSDAVSFTDAGTYELWAVYSGDDNNVGSTSTCGSETVVVDKNSPSINTTPTLQVRDSVSITGLAPVGTFGNLTVKLVDGADCNGNTLYTKVWYGHDMPLGEDAFTGGAGNPYVTDWFTVSTDATLRWCSAYEGDANNAARPFADDNEVIAIDFYPIVQAAALGFAFALPMLAWGAWRRRRDDEKS